MTESRTSTKSQREGSKGVGVVKPRRFGLRSQKEKRGVGGIELRNNVPNSSGKDRESMMTKRVRDLKHVSYRVPTDSVSPRKEESLYPIPHSFLPDPQNNFRLCPFLRCLCVTDY